MSILRKKRFEHFWRSMVLTPLRSMMGIAFGRSLLFSLWLLGCFFVTQGATIQFFMCLWQRLFYTWIRVLHFTSFLRPLGASGEAKGSNSNKNKLFFIYLKIAPRPSKATLGPQGPPPRPPFFWDAAKGAPSGPGGALGLGP